MEMLLKRVTVILYLDLVFYSGGMQHDCSSLLCIAITLVVWDIYASQASEARSLTPVSNIQTYLTQLT